MAIRVLNKICIFNAGEYAYHLTGFAPDVCKGGATVTLLEDETVLMSIPVTDGDTSVVAYDFTTSPRLLDVGEHYVEIVIEEGEEGRFSPADLTVDTIPPIPQPLPGPCVTQTAPPGLFRRLRDWNISNRLHLTELAEVLMLIGRDFRAASRKWDSYIGEDGIQFEIPIDFNVGSGVLIAQSAQRTIVMIYGTTTTGQLITQGNDMLDGPQESGGFGTTEVWFRGARRVLRALWEETQWGDEKTTYIGHSMGGAIATVLAVTRKLARPNAETEVVTFGAPRPGDQRWLDVLKTIRRVHLHNDGDMIPYTLPYQEEIPGWGALFENVNHPNVHEWKSVYPTSSVSDTGEITYDNFPEILVDILAAEMARIVARVAIRGAQPHAMQEYWLRLSLRKSPIFLEMPRL